MFCQNCGAQLPEGTEICPQCAGSTGFQSSQGNNTKVNYQQDYSQQGYSQQGYSQQPGYQNYQQPYNPYPQQVINAPASTGLKVLCFFIPIIGIIMYLVNRDTKPQEGKDCLKMSLISIGVGVGFYFLFIFLAIILGISGR